MFRIKPHDNGLHDGPPHEIRLAPYPVPLAVDAERLRLPLIQPEGKRGGPLYLFLSQRSASQSGSQFYAKVARMAILWANEKCNLSTIKKQANINVLTCFMLAY